MATPDGADPRRPSRPGIALRLYGWLLRAYPPEFRARFAEDMTADVAAMLEERRPLAVLRIVLSDTVRGVAREWLRAWRVRGQGGGNGRRGSGRRIGEMMRGDLRHGVRVLARAPGFTVAASLGLALGIGATAAIFSVLDVVVLRPLPFDEPDRLVRIWEVTPQGEDFSTSQPNVLDFRARNRTFSSLGAFTTALLTLTGDDEPEQVGAALLTPDVFAMLGGAPLLGRVFTEEEARPGGGSRVIVLSEAFWRSRFGGDASVLGRTLTLNGASFQVVGVMPASFEFPAGATAWLPLVLSTSASRGDHRILAIGRLRPGVTLEMAATDLDGVARQLGQLYPESNAGWTVRLATFPDWIVGPTLRRAIMVVLLAAGLLLLMACVNVAHLLLVRATARERELAVRAALGASRGRIVSQLVAESLVLALLAGALGIALAYAAVPLLVRLSPPGVPRIEAAAVDGRVLAFAALVSLATGLLFGLLPALRASQRNLHGALHAGARVDASAGRRLREALLAAELALATMLLVGASLLSASFARLQSTDTGYDAANVLAIPVGLTGRYYAGCPMEGAGDCDRGVGAARLTTFLAQASERLRALPGVTAVGATNITPLAGGSTGQEITVERHVAAGPADRPWADWRAVTAGFFDALGLPIVRGRGFTPAEERDGAPVVVVSETLARRYFPQSDALGKRIAFGVNASNWRTIVGIARDMRDTELQGEPRAVAYVPYGAVGWSFMTLLVRSRTDAAPLAGAVRREIWAVDPALPLPDVRPLDGYRADATAGARFSMLLMTTFALVALVLGVLGVYGVTLFSVARRTRELGLRLALGAGRHDVLAMVLGQSIRTIALGVLLGLAGAAALSRLIAALLFETAPREPALYAGAAIGLALVALIGSLMPALRATRVDPRLALSAE